jgi:hypothetical protein
MPRTQFSTTDLNHLRHQLDTWRHSRSGYRLLPESVWTSAATLAAMHGVGFVARSLRLDYNKLKRQVSQPRHHSALVPTPAFVELPLPTSLPRVSTVCRIELSNPAGAKMTVDLPYDYDSTAVVGLAQAFWRCE